VGVGVDQRYFGGTDFGDADLGDTGLDAPVQFPAQPTSAHGESVPGPSRPSTPLTSTWRPAHPVDVVATLSSLRRGRGDPTSQVTADGSVWRTARTPAGPATICLRQADGRIDATAWGAGAEWLLAGVPELLGGAHMCAGFDPAHPVLREAHRRHVGLRVPRTRLVFEALVPAVLEQKVTGLEARRSWRELVRRYGEPAPGPAPVGLRVAPSAAGWARIPSWEWRRAGVDGKRSRTVASAARLAARIEECVGMTPDDAMRRLTAVPGVGPWTAAEVAQRALGDCDAVSVGDFHLPALVGWALAGRPVDDDGMLELLARYRPHRYRAVRLVELTVAKPRFGPRYSPQDFRHR